MRAGPGRKKKILRAGPEISAVDTSIKYYPRAPTGYYPGAATAFPQGSTYQMPPQQQYSAYPAPPGFSSQPPPYGRTNLDYMSAFVALLLKRDWKEI